MKTVLKICGICLVSAACSTFSGGGEQSFTGEMQRWLGRPEGQLYQVWGAPANVYNVTPQEKVLTYVRTSWLRISPNNIIAKFLLWCGAELSLIIILTATTAWSIIDFWA